MSYKMFWENPYQTELRTTVFGNQGTPYLFLDIVITLFLNQLCE